MKGFLATALLALSVNATKEVLVDYVDVQGEMIDENRVVTESVTVDELTVVDDPYTVGELVSVDGEFCERAVGHDGHYVDGVWVHEDDYDYEPEWRCLMRPLLVQAVGFVEDAELSIESKALLEEKKELVAVHERLVIEAETRKQESLCIEIIEKAMAALEECELQVLRNYVEIADTYPQSWLQLLNEKVECVDTFSRATASCNHLWTDQWERYYGEWTPTVHVPEPVVIIEPVPVIVNPVVNPIPAGPPAVTNDNYFMCALEHQNNDCQCEGGYVFYGTEASIHEGQYSYMQVTGKSMTCNNQVFGDPLPGVVKQCYCVNGHQKKASDCESHETFNSAYSQCN